MIDVKNSFLSGLDLDTSLLSLKKDAYIDALNITRDAVSGNKDFDITNIIGNQEIPDFIIWGEGRKKCIGSYANTLRNTIIYFIWHELDYHAILQYNDTTRTIEIIMFNLVDTDNLDVLEFTENGKITSINVYNREEGDLLYFLDSAGRPNGLNIERFLNDEYVPVTRQILNVIKAPPLFAPTCLYGNDTTTRSNNLKNKEFRFAQLFVYDDFEESVFSPTSAMPIPVKILDQEYSNVITNNNVINLSLDSGAKNVKSIKLLVSIADKQNVWSDFQLVEDINKADIGLQGTTAQFPSGTTTRTTLSFSGYISLGTVVNVYLTLLPSTPTLVGTYTTLAGDTISDVVVGLIASMGGLGIVASPSVYGNGLYFDFNNVLYSFDEVEITQGSSSLDDITFSYSFYNDSTYPIYSIARQQDLFDYVPHTAKAQDMPNGNVLAYGGIEEGYDNDLEPNVVNTVSTVVAGSGGSTGVLSGVSVQTTSGIIETWRNTFSGVPAVGTVVVIRFLTDPGGVPTTAATYTTVLGDTPTSVAAALAASLATIGIAITIVASGASVSYIVAPGYNFNSLIITPPATSATANSIATWKWSTSRYVGIAYFDQNGVTNGILYSAKLSFPAYSESGGGVQLPYINMKIYHVPPDWAHSYSINFTKEPTQYLFWESSDVITTETDYLYFNVNGLTINAQRNPTTATVLSYSFQEGDRMRLIKNVISSVVFPDTYDAAIEGRVVDPTINGVVTVGEFIKIKKVSPFTGISYTDKNFVLEIYRPSQNAAPEGKNVFFEAALNLPILNPTESDRAHSGLVTDQDTDTGVPAELNIYSGDSYFRVRSIYLAQTPSVATLFVQDRNLVDFYISAVNSVEGRPNAIDTNAKRAFYGAVVRHGQEYQPNTNVNGLNRFPAANLLEVSYSYGDIIRMKVRDKIMRVFQSNKTGFIPLFSQIHRNAVGGEIIAQTDKLLNPVQYYVGDWGIGTAPASLASFNFSDYYCDNIRGVVVRVSNDGQTPISVLYKINSFATEQLPKRTGESYHIYGAYQQKTNNYIVALEATDTEDAYTFSFDEETNAFESFLSYHPEMMCALGTQFVTWLNTDLYTHDSLTYNRFYYEDYESNITVVFNMNGLEKKTFESLNEIASTIWDCPLIYTNVETYSGQRQESSIPEAWFKVLEGNPAASILRDTHSPKGLLNGNFMKGNWLAVKFRRQSASNLIYLSVVSMRFVDSPLTAK